MESGTICGLALVVSSLVMGCGGSKANVESAAGAGASAPAGSASPAAAAASSGTPAAASSAAAGSPAATPAGGATTAAASAQAPAPAARPFAKTALEAQSLIQDQIDAHMKPLLECVTAYRSRKGDPHLAVVVDVGIDQEGTLLGVVSPNPKKGNLDPALKDCLWATLHGLPFPRSHAGVITVRQTFTDVVTQQ